MTLNKKTKILFTDLDGTLLDDKKQITRENRETMNEALSEGHKIVVCTGRSLPSALMIAERAGLTREGCYVIAFNGAQIYEPFRQRTLFSRPLPCETAKSICREALSRGLYIQSYLDGVVMAPMECKELKRYLAGTSNPWRVEPDIDAAIPEDPYKLICISFDERQKQDQFRREVLDPLAGAVDTFYSNDAYLEIVSSGVSKGAAVRRMCQYMEIPLENSVAAGDAGNDVEMLKAAHVGAAMRNSFPGVKEYADYVTEKDNNHGGWSEIVRKFILD